MISVRKAKQVEVTTMFTYSHANKPLGQSERAYYLSYFMIKLAVRETKERKTSGPLEILSSLVVGISILISYRRNLCHSLRELE